MSVSSCTCRVCNASFGGETFSAKEMLLGTRHEFDYWECSDCGCVQILEVPPDLSDYYPKDYFAFRTHHRLARSRLRPMIDRRRVRHAMTGKGWLGRIANRVLKPLDYVAWCRLAGVEQSARVLDVGCGTGKLPLRMKLGGFIECVGVDPHIDADIVYANGACVHKKDLGEFAREAPHGFDLIMFHHSLEHVPNPRATLIAARGLLRDNGRILIRLPVAGCLAWRRYRADWVQLDPPRHLWLPTVEGMYRLAHDTGYSVKRVHHDSTALQFIGSELYQRNIPMNAPRLAKDIFSRKQRRYYEEMARDVNDEEDGDQAVFVLTSVGEAG